MCWQSSTLQSSVSTPQLQVGSFDRSYDQTLHGEVSTTLFHMQEKFWIMKLRSLTKRAIHNCGNC